MVHVLLGFMSHALPHFSELHRDNKLNNILLGREGLPMFHLYRFDFAPLRCIRMACDLLGPMGNEQCGVRDKWLAFLAIKDKKSILQPYKDNRFNAAFECASQVFHHKDDIIEFLDKIECTNRQLQSLKADINDNRVLSMIHALAVLFVKVTGI